MIWISRGLSSWGPRSKHWGKRFLGLSSLCENMGNPKTLTPGPRTPTMDRVHRLPLRTPPSHGPSPNKIKNKNRDFTYSLSNRSLMSAKFLALCWETGLGSVLGTSYIIADHYIFALFFAAALHKKPASLRKFVPSSPLPFCMARSLAGSRAQFSAFTLPLSSHSLIRMNERIRTLRWTWITLNSFVLFFWVIHDFRCDFRSF